MTGTIILDNESFFDLRTVDFCFLVELLRQFSDKSDAVKKILKTTDEYALNMLCADELSPKEYIEFEHVLKQIQRDLGEKDSWLKDFLQKICAKIEFIHNKD